MGHGAEKRARVGQGGTRRRGEVEWDIEKRKERVGHGED